MKIAVSALSVLAFSASALAQAIEIVSPVENQTVSLGQPLVIQIAQPFSVPAVPFENIAITLGIEHCGSTPCPSDENNEALGQILLRSLFEPQLNASLPFSPPTQYFNITPTGEGGFAILHAAAFILTGPGPIPQIVQQNLSIILA